MFTVNDRKVMYAIAGALGIVIRQGDQIMASVADIDAAVADLTIAVDAAVDAIGRATGIDPATLDHVVTDINAQTDRLKAAVADAVAKAHSAGM